ncbi:hypothetical protein SLE2022_146000 [Rubroshorea leprosula]
MAKIFEKFVEENDIENKLRIPSNSNLEALPPCRPGQEAKLKVEDEDGKIWEFTYTIRTENRAFFTKGWLQFAASKGIEVGNMVTLFKDDDQHHFSGCGADQYKITVKT